MASELQISATLNFEKTLAVLAVSSSAIIDVAGSKYCDLIQDIATTNTVISFGDVGTVGAYLLQNLDPTNYVDVGFNGTTYQFRLSAGTATETGGFLIGQNNGATINAKANSAPCRLVVRGISP